MIQRQPLVWPSAVEQEAKCGMSTAESCGYRMHIRREDLEKVLGKENPADLGTKHLATGAEVWKHLEIMNIELRDGRSELALDAAKL